MISKILLISRPRFWLYTFGPFLLGAVAAKESFVADPLLVVFGVYFLISANILIYGINDIFDFETDKLNPKKQEKELLVRKEFHPKLISAMLWTNAPFLGLLPFLSLDTALWFVAFLFLGIFYSAPPFRFKAKPFLDSASNVLYALPGFFTFSLLSEAPISWQFVLAASCWTAAMHAYSAVPDIEEDTAANINTIATTLGGKGTLVLCAVLYAASGVLTFATLGWFTLIAGLLYVALCIRTMFLKNKSALLKQYYLFPYINMTVGMILFFILLFQ